MQYQVESIVEVNMERLEWKHPKSDDGHHERFKDAAKKCQYSI